MIDIQLIPIIPRVKIFTTKVAYTRAVNDAINTVSDEAIELLGATTRTWKKPVKFAAKGNQYQRTVYTDNKIWNMLNEGTEPHMIFPRKAKRLAFGLGFKAKTKVRTMASYNGSKGGGTVVFSKGVHHPGTAAREWMSIAQGRMNSRLNGEVRKQLSQLPGLALLGRGIKSL